MSFVRAPTKDPNSILHHAHEWRDWLEGEAVEAFEVFASHAELIVDDVAIEGTQVRYTVRGGVIGRSYVVTSRVTTSTGRRDDYSVRYVIGDK